MKRFAPSTASLWALASAALLALAGRPHGFASLAWVAFVPLFAVLPRARSWRSAALLAGVASLGITTMAYEAAAALGAGWHVFAVVVGAVPFALAGASAWAVARHLPPAFSYTLCALFWVVAEVLQAQPSLLGAYALPLSTFAYSQAGQPAMYLARFSSITATSAVLLLANAAFTHLFVGLRAARGRWHLRWALAPSAGLAVLAALVAGAWASAPIPTGSTFDTSDTFDVAVVQPDRPTSVLAAARNVAAVRDWVVTELASLAASSAQPPVGAAASAVGTGTLKVARGAAHPQGGELGAAAPVLPAPDLVLIPEGAWPHAISTEAPGRSLPAASAVALAALPTTVLGAAGYTTEGHSTNSAFLWSGDDLRHVYAKHHLVPVGEAGLVAGPPPAPVAVAPGRNVIPLICYDVAFPATIRRAVVGGAQLLAVLTDDAFAARGDVPHQHLRLARFRAVETGVPLAFASNTGPSALFHGDGSLAAASSAGQTTALRAELGAGAGPTPYLRYGNWVGALMCLAAIVTATLAGIRAAGKRGGDAPSPTPVG